MNNLTVNIIGAGAVGHLWTCLLTRGGLDVSLYTRSPRKPQPITVDSPTGAFACNVNYRTLDQWKEADVTLVCVKAFHLTTLCQTLADGEHHEKPIILVMNGMGLVEIVANILPNTPVFQASFIQGALLNNAHLTHTGKGDTDIGDLSGMYEHNPIKPIITCLNSAIPNVSWRTEHQQTMLLKLFTNAVINPVTALKGIKNGEMIIDGELDSLAQALLQELSPLMHELLPSLSFQAIQQKIIAVAQGTANNRSSMLRDVELGRQTEIDFINGYLITLAKERSIDMREHCKIVAAIHTLNS
jgi:2-dehydropantoate 2-reductase